MQPRGRSVGLLEAMRSAHARAQPRAWYRWEDPAYVFMMQSLERQALRLFRQHRLLPLKGKQVFELGCGTGYWLRQLVKWGAEPERITGLDLLPERLAESRSLGPPDSMLVCGSAGQLPFPAGSFDLVLQSTVFSSITASETRRVAAAELLRVLGKSGTIVWYDFFVRHPRNPDVRAMRRQEIHRLFPDCRIRLRRVTLAPPISRALAAYFLPLCGILERFPLLRTHYLGVIRKG